MAYLQGKSNTKAYLNIPYDEAFITNNNRVFLEPMTFKDSISGKLLPVWLYRYGVTT